MRKVWNVAKKAYDYVADGIFIDGIDYDKDAALKKWNERGGADKCSALRAKQLIKTMIENNASFDKHHQWLEEMEYQILLENNAMIERVKGKGSGVNATKEFQQIPSVYRAGILAIANNNVNRYARGAHSTCPARQVSEVSNYKEFHLTITGENGRATTAKSRRGGEIFIYYSTSHAFGTYDYYLVTIPVTIERAGGTVTMQVPLTAGTRDGLIALPTA